MSGWMHPELYDGPYTRSIDPNFKAISVADRELSIGKILEAGIVTSVEAIRKLIQRCPMQLSRALVWAVLKTQSSFSAPVQRW